MAFRVVDSGKRCPVFRFLGVGEWVFKHHTTIQWGYQAATERRRAAIARPAWSAYSKLQGGDTAFSMKVPECTKVEPSGSNVFWWLERIN